MPIDPIAAMFVGQYQARRVPRASRLSDMIGHRLNEIPVGPDYTRPHPHSSVGIEVEVEGIREYRDTFFKRWRIDENEGSLVNGIEFISEPVWGTAITDTLEELADFFAIHPPYISFRTSVHVHLNVLDLTPKQLKRMIELYLVYEPALFRLHDKWDRGNCIFCVPAHQSVVIQQGYSGLFRDLDKGGVNAAYSPWKYSALNTNCLRTLGTLEFRHMGGTDDMNEVSNWIDVLLQLKVAAILDEPLFEPAEVWQEQLPKLTITDEDLTKGKRLVDYLNIWR